MSDSPYTYLPSLLADAGFASGSLFAAVPRNSSSWVHSRLTDHSQAPVCALTGVEDAFDLLACMRKCGAAAPHTCTRPLSSLPPADGAALFEDSARRVIGQLEAQSRAVQTIALFAAPGQPLPHAEIVAALRAGFARVRCTMPAARPPSWFLN